MPLSLSSAQQAECYRGLFVGAADSILVADGDGHYLDANPAALGLLGYTLDELLQLHVSDVSAQAPAELQDRYARLKRDHGWHGESIFRRKDGSVFPVDVRASQADLAEGTVYFSNFRDITERKHAETALRASEARLEALLAQIPVGIGMTDTEGRWVLINPILRQVMGETVPSRDPYDGWRWRTWDARGRQIEPTGYPLSRALRGESVGGMEFLYTPQQGEAVWTRVSAVPFRSATDEVVGAITV